MATKSKRKPVRGGGVHRGKEARERVNEEISRNKAKEEARKAAGNKPFRFWMPPDSEREIIIVDDAPDFFMYEHNMKNPATGRYDFFTGCTRDYDNCPICEASGKEGSYNMYLSVIDLHEFDDRQGKTHEFSRKLFVVKSGQQKKFLRKFESEGTLRGAKFLLVRDGDRDPAIGNDIEFLEFVDEDDLLEFEREWKDKDGKKQVEVCHEPIDYEELFPEFDSESLAEEYAEVFGADSVEPTPGSKKANERSSSKSKSKRRSRTEDDDEEEDDDEPPWDDDEAEEEKPRAKTKAKSKRRRAVDEDEEEAEEEVDEDEEEEEKPSRRRSRKAEPEEEDEDEEEEEKPTRRRGGVRRGGNR